MSGRIREDDVNAIRERNDIVEIVSDYIALKKKGKLLWGLCPFHQEKTPSFKVDPVAQLYHCFGCSEGGNVFTFIMKVEHLEFPEAVEALANRIGYKITYESSGSQKSSKKDRIFEANRLAMQFYQYILLNLPGGSGGLSYLKKRGLKDSAIREFGLGFAPKTWSSTLNYLTKKGFSKEEIFEAGLIVEGKGNYYDRFRGRVIFPIADIRGRTIAFGGRVLGNDQPKYLNSSETAIYRKSSTLYGLHMAKNEMVRTGTAIVVEGYMDVLAMAQAGITNTVATLGTAFTAEHVELLKRFADRVVLVFDADAAGIKATQSASAYLSEFRLPRMEALRDLEKKSGAFGLDMRVVMLPQNLDPADYIGTEGPDSFRGLIGSAEPFFDFFLSMEMGKYNISEIRQKEQAVVACFKLIAMLDHPTSQKEYLSKIAQKLEIDEKALTVKYNSMFGKSMAIKKEARATTLDPQEKIERSFFHIVLNRPELRGKVPDEIDSSYFISPAHAKLFTVLKEMGAGKFDAGMLNEIDEGLAAKVTEHFFAESEYEEEDLSKYFEDILISLKDFHYRRQINKLKKELQALSAQEHKDDYDSLFEELIELEAKSYQLRQGRALKSQA